VHEIPDVNALEAELNDFHAAIVMRRKPRVDFREGARSLRIALKVASACRDAASAAGAIDKSALSADPLVVR
jgi:hypothetical protein